MFKVAYRRVTDVEPFVYPACPTGEGALGLGTAAVLTAGVLAKCGDRGDGKHGFRDDLDRDGGRDGDRLGGDARRGRTDRDRDDHERCI